MGGVLSIKKHPFFASIDWQEVLDKKLKPPIKIKVKQEYDTKNMDKQYLKEAIKNTPERDGGVNLALLNKMHFDNFTFNGDEGDSMKNGKKEDQTDDLYDQVQRSSIVSYSSQISTEEKIQI